LRFREHVTTSLGQTTVNTSNSSLRTLDLTQVNWLQETRVGPQNRGVADATSGGDDLTTSSVDGVSVQSNVVDVNSNSSHVLLTQNSLVGSPLESSNDRVFNFVEILDPLRYIDHELGPVWSGPKHQILRASVGFQLVSSSFSSVNLSQIIFDRAFGSCLGVIVPSSIITEKSSPRGWAWQKRRLCLFGDLDRHIMSDLDMIDSL